MITIRSDKQLLPLSEMRLKSLLRSETSRFILQIHLISLSQAHIVQVSRSGPSNFKYNIWSYC